MCKRLGLNINLKKITTALQIKIKSITKIEKNKSRTTGLCMKTTTKAIVVAFIVAALLAWAPWITDDFAVNKVVERLGGSETRFNYLNQDMAVKDVPKQVIWVPFGRYVVFPGEAGWFVGFYGSVN